LQSGPESTCTEQGEKMELKWLLFIGNILQGLKQHFCGLFNARLKLLIQLLKMIVKFTKLRPTCEVAGTRITEI